MQVLRSAPHQHPDLPPAALPLPPRPGQQPHAVHPRRRVPRPPSAPLAAAGRQPAARRPGEDLRQPAPDEDALSGQEQAGHDHESGVPQPEQPGGAGYRVQPAGQDGGGSDGAPGGEFAEAGD